MAKGIPRAVLREALAPVLRAIEHDARTRVDADGGRVLRQMGLKLCDGDVTMAVLCAAAGVPKHVGRALARDLGMPAWSYFVERRLEVCARLLLNARLEELSCAAIAPAAGFKRRYNTFAKQFKAWSGQSPGAFREAPNAEVLERLRLQEELPEAPAEDADADAGEGSAEAPDVVEPVARATVGELLQASRDAVAGRRANAAVAAALQAIGVVEEHGPAERASEVHAEAGMAFQYRAGRRLQRFDAEGAFDDVVEAASHYAAAGRWSPRIEYYRQEAVAPCDPRRPLLRKLCERCRPRLLGDAGRELRDALADALQRIPADLPFFDELCDRCYVEVWRDVERARRVLENDAWRAAFLAAFSDDPDDEASTPSVGLLVHLLEAVEGDAFEERPARSVRERETLARRAVAVARTLGGGEREDMARLQLAGVLTALGELDEASAEVDAVGTDGGWLRAGRLVVRAGLDLRRGDVEAALNALEEAFAVYAPLDGHQAGLMRIFRGDVERGAGRPAAALAAFEEAAERLDARRDPLVSGALLPIRRAETLVALGRYEEVDALLGDCDTWGFPSAMIARALLQRAVAALGRDDLASALRHLDRSRELAQGAGRWRDAALASLYSVEAHVRLGDRLRAVEAAAAAQQAFASADADAVTRRAVDRLAERLGTLHVDVDAVASAVRRLARHHGGSLPLAGEDSRLGAM